MEEIFMYKLNELTTKVDSTNNKVETATAANNMQWSLPGAKSTTTTMRLQAQECMRVASDATERSERANNIKVSGLPEAQVNDGDNRSEKQDFIEMCNDVLGISLTVEKTHRVGRTPAVNDTKPRSMIVTFNNAQHRRLLLQKAHLLKNSARFGNVFIGPDLTRMQEKEAFEMRKACRTRNAALCNVDKEYNPFVVFKGKLLRRSDIHRPADTAGNIQA
jgi:hypothetical protein